VDQKATKREVRIRITSKEGKTSTHPICPTREETRLYDEISKDLNSFGVAIANNHFILFLITAAPAAFKEREEPRRNGRSLEIGYVELKFVYKPSRIDR